MTWIHDALERIKLECVPHRNYARALAQANAMLLVADGGEVICITGPSRVGKSRIAAELTKLILGKRHVEDSDLMPVVYIDAQNAAIDSTFQSKHFTFHLLQAIKHPIYGMEKTGDKWGVELARLFNDTSERTLNEALDKALMIRKTRYLIIDETHHILYSKRGPKDAAAFLDSWKCRAEKLKIVLVLVGAYPILNVLALTPHLLGRKHQLHLSRYYPVREDLLIFYQILDFYSTLLRFPPGVTSLRDWGALLYRESLGCIGLLSAWLRGSLALALADNSETLNKEHLQKARKSKFDLKNIEQEIKDGERAIMVDGDNDDAVEQVDVKAGPTSTKEPTVKKQTKVRKPFQKKPRRYAVEGRA